MKTNFSSLMFASILIVISSFCLVFSLDHQKSRQSRRMLLVTAFAGFIIVGIICYGIFQSPMN